MKKKKTRIDLLMFYLLYDISNKTPRLKPCGWGGGGVD